jgi:tRNA(Ile)-lysidine synthase
LDGEEKIVLAHHIDDSFEWTLLQSLRSSNIEGLVGIPLLNGKVIRPFMCVTKAQIGKFVQAFDLPFIEDPTNESLKYERNYIRNEVIPAFSDRYKQYLKHYVYRHNEISRRLGMHLLDRNRSYFEIVKGSQSVLIYSLSVNH